MTRFNKWYYNKDEIYTRDSWIIPETGTDIWCTAWPRGQTIKPYGDGCHVIVGFTVYHCDEFMEILDSLIAEGCKWGMDGVEMTREYQINGQWTTDINTPKTTRHYTEKTANEFAKETSKSIVIRSYNNGNSSDDRREATPEEAELVERAIAAALIAIRDGYDKESAKATAEFFVIYNSDETHINTYDSVYIPIDNFLRDYKEEN